MEVLLSLTSRSRAVVPADDSFSSPFVVDVEGDAVLVSGRGERLLPLCCPVVTRDELVSGATTAGSIARPFPFWVVVKEEGDEEVLACGGGGGLWPFPCPPVSGPTGVDRFDNSNDSKKDEVPACGLFGVGEAPLLLLLLLCRSEAVDRVDFFIDLEVCCLGSELCARLGGVYALKESLVSDLLVSDLLARFTKAVR